jgi:hypothetical protein
MKKRLDLTELRELRELRLRHKLNQSNFWQRFTITQSGGSRYERGRPLPRPLALLIHFWHSGKITDKELAEAGKKLGFSRPKAI